jgi:regulator of sirC expression with transglutaminase-like and TPR domain
MGSDPRDRFSRYSNQGDDDIDLIRALCDFSSLWYEGVSFQSYLHQTEKLASAVEQRFAVLCEAGGVDNAGTRLAALHDVIMLDQGYSVVTGDMIDPMIHADLVEVVKSRKGVPIIICALFAGVARSLGWDLQGLDLGGHFIGRMDYGSERMMFDPAQGCRLLQAHDLREILKKRIGDKTELSSTFYEPVSVRSWVMKVQNLIKLHQIRMEDYQDALKTVEALRVFAPHEYRLLFDAGILYARLKQREPAIFALEHYVDKTPDPRSRQEALFLLSEIKDIFE